MITYQIEKTIPIEEFKELLIQSTLGERRPIEDDDRLQKMLDFGNLLVTARDNGKLVGISRALTDFAFCTYLSDLAVDRDYQKQGIGTELIRQTKLASPMARLILLAAPAAIGYYPKIGMTKYEHCFLLDDVNNLNK
ncbi:GNAT family N-acetyltransferase [Solitalea longa]|uniref:GNAT family N-acetyltransferase n=1 Tax=Solitalea longa TaxID=2079460 RepID=A0A2S4ZYG5_9SPHI|nr:GNAT family N-acetyltransferase [Solitalea longa]POY35391.1 GNAT family N-acetyltransferase [Solitalea longa]